MGWYRWVQCYLPLYVRSAFHCLISERSSHLLKDLKARNTFLFLYLLCYRPFKMLWQFLSPCNHMTSIQPNSYNDKTFPPLGLLLKRENYSFRSINLRTVSHEKVFNHIFWRCMPVNLPPYTHFYVQCMWTTSFFFILVVIQNLTVDLNSHELHTNISQLLQDTVVCVDRWFFYKGWLLLKGGLTLVSFTK